MGRRFIYDKDGNSFEVPRDYVPSGDVAPMVQGDLPGYLSHGTGKWVEGRAQRREDLLVSGCRPFEGTDSERREAARQKNYNDQAVDRKIEKELRNVVPHMPSHVRRLFE